MEGNANEIQKALLYKHENKMERIFQDSDIIKRFLYQVIVECDSSKYKESKSYNLHAQLKYFPI